MIFGLKVDCSDVKYATHEWSINKLFLENLEFWPEKLDSNITRLRTFQVQGKLFQTRRIQNVMVETT